jgi:hypothetical protein
MIKTKQQQNRISSILATSTYKPAVASSAISSASEAAASIRSVVSEHLRDRSSSDAAQTTTDTTSVETSTADAAQTTADTTSAETSTADAAAETNNEVVSSASRVFENYSFLVQFTVIATILVGSLFAVVA